MSKQSTHQPNALWLNVSPALEKFNRPLIHALAKETTIAQWQYCQTEDEPLSLEIALVLLHDYLKSCDRPLHLLGHSTSGLLGLLYARRHPGRVKSLTLLSVGVHPAVDWQLHYYKQLQLLPYPRETILSQTVHQLFGCQSRSTTQELVQLLQQDLSTALSPHTLYRCISLFPGGVSTPLIVCGSQDDGIVDPNQLQGWQPWFKEGDRLWQCPSGRHFFHRFYPELVSHQITDFWNSLEASTPLGIHLTPTATP
jgi:pimeloyl-ACP methyl ester carboxylesterase